MAATKKTAKTETKEVKKPLFRIKVAGHVYVSCWANTVEKEGKTFTVHNLELYRRYQDSDQKWKTSHYLGINDLWKATLAIEEAQKRLALIAEGVEEEA